MDLSTQHMPCDYLNPNKDLSQSVEYIQICQLNFNSNQQGLYQIPFPQLRLSVGICSTDSNLQVHAEFGQIGTFSLTKPPANWSGFWGIDLKKRFLGYRLITTS